MEDKMVLNDAGKMIQNTWKEIPEFYNDFAIDIFQIMPNHLHGIINIVGADPRVCPDDKQKHNPDKSWRHEEKDGQPQGVAPTVAKME